MRWRPLVVCAVACAVGVAASRASQDQGNHEPYLVNLLKWYNGPLFAIALCAAALATVLPTGGGKARLLVKVCGVVIALCALVQSRYLYVALIYPHPQLWFGSTGGAALCAALLWAAAVLTFALQRSDASKGKPSVGDRPEMS